MQSTLTKSQTKRVTRTVEENGKMYNLTVDIRYDDQCNNGHNSFAITGKFYSKTDVHDRVSGCIHDIIAKHCPDVAKYIKWHLTSSDGPMHYIANSLYWAGQTKYPEFNLEHFRKTAVWPEATEVDMRHPQLRLNLELRLPKIMEEFQHDMIELGFQY